MARSGRTALRKSQPAFVYVLRCADGSLYTGWTTDLVRRLREHRACRASKYTRSRLPVELAGWFKVRDRTQARRSEAKLKLLRRELKLELLERYFAGSRVKNTKYLDLVAIIDRL